MDQRGGGEGGGRVSTEAKTGSSSFSGASREVSAVCECVCVFAGGGGCRVEFMLIIL